MKSRASETALCKTVQFCYCGYVYDWDTGLYYLQSRYYDPEIGRFISADAFASTGQGLLGNNMFAYCGNNPVNRVDWFGTCYYTVDGVWTHDAWENYGGYEKKPDPNAIDITEKLTKAMIRHAEELSDFASRHSNNATLAFFLINSKTGGAWDFKNQADWNLNENQLYRFRNMIIRYDAVANIHYGFVGRVICGEEDLLKAAGIAQIFDGTSNSSFANSNHDDPYDQWAIRVGMRLWEVGIFS